MYKHMGLDVIDMIARIITHGYCICKHRLHLPLKHCSSHGLVKPSCSTFSWLVFTKHTTSTTHLSLSWANIWKQTRQDATHKFTNQLIQVIGPNPGHYSSIMFTHFDIRWRSFNLFQAINTGYMQPRTVRNVVLRVQGWGESRWSSE